MMKVKIVFHGHLKQYNDNKAEIEQQLPEGTTVQQIIAGTGVPPAVIAFAAVNGSRVPLSFEVQNRDEVKLFQMVGGG